MLSRILVAAMGVLATFAAVGAPILSWDAVSGADGYFVYCEPTPIAGAPTQIDAGANITVDLVGQVLNGTEYECWVTAWAAGVPESGESNHIRFTPPEVVQTIVVPGQPSSVTIQWQ